MLGRRARGSELYGGGGFDFWGPEADEEEREQEMEEGKRGKEKGEEMFFGLLCIPPPLSLSRPHAATHGHPPICT
jgi:hypothetical protein